MLPRQALPPARSKSETGRGKDLVPSVASRTNSRTLSLPAVQAILLRLGSPRSRDSENFTACSGSWRKVAARADRQRPGEIAVPGVFKKRSTTLPQPSALPVVNPAPPQARQTCEVDDRVVERQSAPARLETPDNEVRSSHSNQDCVIYPGQQFW